MATTDDYGHKVDDVSVPLVHLHLDHFTDESACLVLPAFYVEEERTRIFLARRSAPFLGSTAGQACFRPLVERALQSLARGNSRELGRLIARVPTVLSVFSEVLQVVIDQVRLGERSLLESLRAAMPKRPVNQGLKARSERLETLRMADAMSERGHFVFVADGKPGVILRRTPTSDQRRLLEVAGDADGARALGKARQGKRREPQFNLAVAVIGCRAHVGSRKPEPALHAAPWLVRMPWDSQEQLGRQRVCSIGYFVDPALPSRPPGIPVHGVAALISSAQPVAARLGRPSRSSPPKGPVPARRGKRGKLASSRKRGSRHPPR
jgi:hypothetical protein